MTRRARRPARWLALLTVPLVLLLGGCLRVDAGVVIHPDDTVDLDLAVLDKTGTMSRDELDCAALAEQVTRAGLGGVDYTVRDLDEGGRLGCALAVARAPMAEMSAAELSITRSGDLDTFSLAGLGEQAAGTPGLELRLAVSFPGEVVDAGGGKVSGTTVTWTDPAVLATGVNATGHAGGAASRPDPGGASAATPWLWWALGGIAVVAAAGGLVSLARRGR